jgi:hypothetical protein
MNNRLRAFVFIVSVAALSVISAGSAFAAPLGSRWY